MDEENKQLVDEEGKYIMQKDTEQLEVHYEELLKEIGEKSELMIKSREEKEINKNKLKE